jgi:hypothetical protein
MSREDEWIKELESQGVDVKKELDKLKASKTVGDSEEGEDTENSPIPPDLPPMGDLETEPNPASGSVPDSDADSEEFTIDSQTTAGGQGNPNVDDRMSGTGLEPRSCINCGMSPTVSICENWEKEDASRFIEAILLNQNFFKTFEFFGGALNITIRALTVKEVQAIYHEVYRRVDADEVRSKEQFADTINRLRLFLQVESLKISGRISPLILADGLSAETNPYARKPWKEHKSLKRLARESREAGKPLTLLAAIEKFFEDNVFTRDVFYRVADLASFRFNQLLLRLESRAMDKDFFQTPL